MYSTLGQVQPLSSPSVSQMKAGAVLTGFYCHPSRFVHVILAQGPYRVSARNSRKAGKDSVGRSTRFRV